MLKELFKKTFDIRDGEIHISFFMQLYIFLLITVLLMVKPTINALFLSKLGADHLPYGYILVAVIALITMFFYNKAIKKFSLRIITISTLVFFSLSFLLLSLLMFWGALSYFALYAYYLSVALFAVLVTSQFWIIANMVYNAREAKRLFGFIGAGAIAGGIFGGYLTSIIAPAFGNRVVMLLAAALLLCCIPILNSVWKIRIRKLNVYIRNQRKNAEKQSYTSPYKIVLKSKHLTYLAAIVGVGVIMAKLVDFQFSDFANRAIPDSDELASFFGFWFSTFNVIALLIQLFLTNRMLAWLGVTTNLMLLPFGIAIGCLLFLTFPELWVLIIIKGLDGSFKQSINKAGIELSILPIPYHIKSQAKSFIDVVVDSFATGIAGLLLFFVVRGMNLNSSYITVIILLILFIWIFLIYKLRETYFESFRTNIQSSLQANSQVKKKISLETTTNSTIQVLSNGSEIEILNLLDRLQNYRLKSLEPHIIKLLDHPSNEIKSAAITQLYFYKKGTAINRIKELIHTKDDDVVYRAMDYLLHHTDIDDSRIFESYLNHSSDYITNAALLCLAKESPENKNLAVKYDLNARIERKIRELTTADNDLRKQEVGELMIAIAYAGEPKYYSFISANFNNRDPYVVGHAIKAAGITAHAPFVNDLINFLAEKTFRRNARRALRNYGPEINKTILNLVVSENLDNEVKPYIPKVIESFKSKEGVKILMRLLKSKDFIIRLQAAKSLNKLQINSATLKIDQRSLTKIILKENEYYKNTLNAITSLKRSIGTQDLSETTTDEETDLLVARESLIEILNHQLDQSLECVFKLLSLKYDRVDIETAYFGLKSDVQNTKINAVEFLDNLLQSRLKSSMLPLIEYHIIDNNDYSISSFDSADISEKRVLLMLMKNRGPKVKLAVLNLMAELHDVTFIKKITPLLKHKNKSVRYFAKNALDKIRQGQLTPS
ncbi:NTP/NDP exchange transporter [Ulvibacter antarcticus]|uniref:ADP,ATP carrier protein n=1 Tax=Ulvibacter antarcticus TaxID=442714 RepID=A0A3L9Z342_9FLAO|nr:Npt1/Npt2 family nucleotide transporter [Ulvibacter antarcticus]RMA64758.1 AAA family ATP:ADP antiporter [Ulvibacter antarcticus]